MKIVDELANEVLKTLVLEQHTMTFDPVSASETQSRPSRTRESAGEFSRVLTCARERGGNFYPCGNLAGAATSRHKAVVNPKGPTSLVKSTVFMGYPESPGCFADIVIVISCCASAVLAVASLLGSVGLYYSALLAFLILGLGLLCLLARNALLYGLGDAYGRLLRPIGALQLLK